MKERLFILVPQHCNWNAVQATSTEMAYRKVCSDYQSATPVCVLDPENKTFNIFTRELDDNWNLIKINKVKV